MPGVPSKLPISMHIYPDLDRNSFFRALGRDCERLAACGMHVVKSTQNDEQLYRIDEKNSFIGDAKLTQEEALSPGAALPAGRKPRLPACR